MSSLLEWLSIIAEFTYLQLYTMYVYTETIIKYLFPPECKSLSGEIILITGAGRGIGHEICLSLANLNATLVCWDINTTNNEQSVEKLKSLGCKALAYTVDVSSRQKVAAAAALVKKEVGDVTIVINNAGITNISPLVETTHEQIENIFKINILSNFWVLKEFLPKMIENRRGHIVSVSSGSALMPIRNLIVYGATKHAIHGYMESLREEIRLHPKKPDIKLTTVYPFFCDTEINKGNVANTRFPSLIPIWGPKPVAEMIVEGLRQNKEYIYTPKFLGFMAFLSRFMPNKLIAANAEFFQCTLEPEVPKYS